MQHLAHLSVQGHGCYMMHFLLAAINTIMFYQRLVKFFIRDVNYKVPFENLRVFPPKQATVYQELCHHLLISGGWTPMNGSNEVAMVLCGPARVIQDFSLHSATSVQVMWRYYSLYEAVLKLSVHLLDPSFGSLVGVPIVQLPLTNKCVFER